MKRCVFLAILIVAALSTNPVSGQKVLKKQAVALFDRQNYTEANKALDAYDKLKDDAEALYMKAVCAYHLHQPQTCIDLMKEAFKKGSTQKDIYIYVAKSYQALGNYAEAAVYFKNQLKALDNARGPETDAIIREIKRCEFSPKLIHLPQLAYVDNLGSAANSSYDEVSPIQSPNFQNKYYFASNREQSAGGPRNKNGLTDDLSNLYYYDLYAVELAGGNYSPIQAFGPVQNTTQNEIIQDFSRDGSVMYYLRYAQGTARLMTDTFKEADTEVIAIGSLTSPFDPLQGDRDLRVFNDSTLVFASNRLGGYGGYDIYVCKFKGGQWQNPVNMGSGINSVYDEKSPYLTKGGSVLFFSSDHVQGLGGFDIFASRYDQALSKWGERVQLGQPINSSKDDLDPMVSNDGNQLLFSSDRIEGFGGYDIYVAYFKEQITDQFNYIEDLPMFAAVSQDSTRAEETPTKPQAQTAVKSFAIAPLYFTNDEDVLSPNNQVMLKTIRNLMETFPETRLSIIGHSAVDKQKETALFFTIKRAERVAATLTAAGIAADRIQVWSYGSSFPMVVNDSRYNTRLELLIGKANPLSTEIVEDLPVLNQDVKSAGYTTYTEGRKTLVYKVRFTTARQMVRSDVLLDYPFLSVVKNNQGEYEYFCGYEARYDSARLIKQKLQEKGYTAARVVAFEGHQALSTEDAGRLVQLYPDLQTFLSSEK